MEFSDNALDAADQAKAYWDSKKEKCIWLGPGKYYRGNPDVELDINLFKDLDVDKKGFDNLREAIAMFYNQYIFKSNRLTLNDCCVTLGAVNGVGAGINYFKSKSGKKVLFLTPTFEPLITACNAEYDTLEHFNEPWDETLLKIQQKVGLNNVGCIVIANPNNPAGIVYPNVFLKKLAGFCNKNKVWVLEDGAYFLHFGPQTTVLDYFDYAISFISRTKIFLNPEREVGGAVVSKKLSVDEFSKFTGKVDSRDQQWYNYLLRKVITEPRILEKHLEYAFTISKEVRKRFEKCGFVNLFWTLSDSIKNTSIGPVMSFGYKTKNGKVLNSKTLFRILAENGIITQMIVTEKCQGIRVNTRAVYKEELDLLDACLTNAKKELEKIY